MLDEIIAKYSKLAITEFEDNFISTEVGDRLYHEIECNVKDKKAFFNIEGDLGLFRKIIEDIAFEKGFKTAIMLMNELHSINIDFHDSVI